MELDIKIGERVASVRLVKKEGPKVTIEIDGSVFEVDALKVEEGVYSIIHDGKSCNIEVAPGDAPKNYLVSTHDTSLEIEVIDAQSRYQKNRMGDGDNAGEKLITTPMPGKVVKIPVKLGETVSRGDTVIVIAAMKMESEYKSPVDGVVKRIFVQEGQTINGHQHLVEIE